jgi:transposase
MAWRSVRHSPRCRRAGGEGKARSRQPRRVGHNLLLRLSVRNQGVLRCLTDRRAPFTNNLAERDGRMMKLRQKIADGFRSEDGVKGFPWCGPSRRPLDLRWNVLQTLTSDPVRVIAGLCLG